MNFVVLFILVIAGAALFSVEHECIQKQCSKFSIYTIGIASSILIALMIYVFMQIGWIGDGLPIYTGQDT